ncbi:MAG: hypothetical protein KAI99_08240 [Cyclobacteriaceae bacterium]|nr:hypothetical protein [Cyclobacteriaceae bacterium]
MTFITAFRKGNYKLIEWYESSLLTDDQGFELYNLNEDTGEKENLSIQIPELVEELKAELTRWKKR